MGSGRYIVRITNFESLLHSDRTNKRKENKYNSNKI